jgi:Serine dehydrogenase proteinase
MQGDGGFMDKMEFEKLVADCETEIERDIILLNSPMDPGVDSRLRECITQRQNRAKSVILLLVTEGGLADIAYRSARMLQDKYENVAVCIPGWCKSAGTLLAIGAHELLIGDRGELGPLDVQVAVRDEIGDRNSGLILESAIESMRAESFKLFENFMMEIKAKSGNLVTFRTAADLAAQLTVGLMRPVFKQIDPVKLGDDARSQKIGYHYGIRLNLASKNLKDVESLEMLLRGYPSHSFVIDRQEAAELFTNVQPISGQLSLVIEALGSTAMLPADESIICYLAGGRNEQEAANDEDTEEGGIEGSAETLNFARSRARKGTPD